MVLKRSQWILAVMFFMLLVLGVSVSAAELEEGQTESGRTVADGIYKVISAVDERYVWDISNGSDLDEANLQLWTDNDSDAQKFIFTYSADGYYTITNMNSGKVIECAGSSSQDGANMQQYSGNHTDAQLWKLTYMESGCYTLTCKCNGKVADVQGGIARRGTNMQMYRSNQTAAQEFQLVEATENRAENSGGLHVTASLIFVVEIVAIVGIGCFFRRFQRKRERL